jgi:hypothetical protein
LATALAGCGQANGKADAANAAQATATPVEVSLPRRGEMAALYTGTALVDPLTCPGGRPNTTDPGCAFIDRAADIINGGKTDLGPEEATMQSVGFVWEPTTAFSIGLDWWSIQREGTIQTLSLVQLIDNYRLFPERFIHMEQSPTVRNTGSDRTRWDFVVDARPVVTLYQAFEDALWRRTFVDEILRSCPSRRARSAAFFGSSASMELPSDAAISSATSEASMGGPSSVSASLASWRMGRFGSGVTTAAGASPTRFNSSMAALRTQVPTSRSRFRTPLSRV